MTRREILKLSGLTLSAWALPTKMFAEYQHMRELNEVEVIIIGGSYAGLSTAMSLGRSLRNVLIIDSGSPCNRQAPYSHNLITQDGIPPLQIIQKAKSEILNYKTVKIVNDRALRGEIINGGFIIHTASGQQFNAKKLVFATGIKDIIPPIKGLAECWGSTVIHCPYCHGYEFRNQVTGILANGEKAFQLSAMVHNLTSNLSILTNGKANFTVEQLNKIAKNGINVIETKVAAIDHNDGHIRNVIFEDGTSKSYKALYAGIPFIQHSDIPTSLGCKLTETGHLKIDSTQKTSVEGIYACGDNSTMARSIASAVFSGNLTGAMVNKDLTIETF